MRLLILLVGLLVMAPRAEAEVVDSAANGFAVRNVVQIAAHPSRVYNTAVAFVGRWWNPAHTFSKNAANVMLDARPGGCLCERLVFEWTYTVGGYMPGGLAAIPPAVDAVLADQLQRLKRFIETARAE